MDVPASELSATTTSQRRINLVVILDDQPGGLEGKRSNCLELYSHLIDDNDLQLTYFSSGVGTYSHSRTTSNLTKLKRTINQYADHLFAFSIENRIKAAYQWLSQEYRDGDRIFLFGFSRGAWAVRALASMIDIVGLIKPDNEEQIPYAYDLFRAYQGPEMKGPRSNTFKPTFSREVPKIHFVGTFDTMRPPTGFLGFKSLPLVGKYDNIEHVRHAVAIDEKESRFRRPELYHLEGKGLPPDAHVKEVWFRGTHLHLGKSWTGGGFAPLSWMEWESMTVGLEFKADVSLGWDHWGSWAALRLYPLIGREWLASWIKEALAQPLAIKKQPRTIPIGATLHVSAVYAPGGDCPALDVEPWKTLLTKSVANLPKRPPPGETTYVDFDCFDPDYPVLDYLCDEPVFEVTDEALKTACVLSGFLNLPHRTSIQRIPQGVIDWALIRMLEGNRMYWGKGGWEDIDPWSNSRRKDAAFSCFGAITQTRPKAFWTFLETHPEIWKVDPVNTKQLCLCFTHTLKRKMYENRQTNADGTTRFIPPDGINISYMWNRILEIWDRTGPGFPDDHWDSEDIFEALQRLAAFRPELLEKDGPRIRDAVTKRRQVFENMARFNPERTYQALKWLFPTEGESPDVRQVISDVVDIACEPFKKSAVGYETYRLGDFYPNCFNAGLWKVAARMRGLPDPWEDPDWKTEEQAAEILAAAKASESS